MENIFKIVSAVFVTLMAHLFGSFDFLMKALITLVIIDYITGLTKAYIIGELSSKKGLEGIAKKMMYFAIVAVAVIADNATNANGLLRTAVIGFLIANEALSILENCAAASLPVPGVLIKVLEKLKKVAEEKPPDQDAEERARVERRLP